VARPPSKREAFLSHACAGDPELRSEVEQVLSDETQPTGFLQAPMADGGARAPAWELVSFAIPSGQETNVAPLDLPAAAIVTGFSVHPDGKRVITSVRKRRFDIWQLEGFPAP
jgi:hypothetical protein